MNLKYVIAGLLLVSTVFSLSVNIPNQFQTVQEGQVASFDVMVSNSGQPVNVLITTDSELSVAVSDPLFHLNTNESKDVKVLAVTNGLGKGVYVIKLNINGQEYDVGVNVEAQTPVLSFTPIYNNLEVVQGQYQDLRFILRNNGKERIRNIVIEGNLPETFNAEYPAPIDLAGNEVREVKVRIHVPKDYPVDDYEYTVKAGAGNQIVTAPVYLTVKGLTSVKDRLDAQVLLPWNAIKNDDGKTIGYKITFRIRNRQIYDINNVEWKFANLPEGWKVEGNDTFSIKGYGVKDIALKFYPTSFTAQKVNVSLVKGNETIVSKEIEFSGEKIGFTGSGLVVGGGSAFWGIVLLIAIALAIYYVRNQNALKEEEEEKKTNEYLKELVEKTMKKNSKKK